MRSIDPRYGRAHPQHVAGEAVSITRTRGKMYAVETRSENTFETCVLRNVRENTAHRRSAVVCARSTRQPASTTHSRRSSPEASCSANTR